MAGLNDSQKEKIVLEFVELLPMLRARLGITQQELGRRVGATRQTILFAETKRRPLTWSMFLSLAFLFTMDPRTKPFLMASGLFNEELSHLLFDDRNILAQAIGGPPPEKPMLTKAREMMAHLPERGEQ